MDGLDQMKTAADYYHTNHTNLSLLADWEVLVPDECFPLLGILDFFHLYYIPAIILVGLVGNLLSCIVFLNTHLKMRSSSYYLAALATADFGFLATLMMVWLNNNLGVQVGRIANARVAIFTYLMFTHFKLF